MHGEAHTIFAQIAGKKAHDFAFLQDRIRDEYHIINLKTGEKQVL